MLSLLGMLALLQQGVYQGATTPPSGDTLGYWQQHVAYTIVATLDEPNTRLRAHGTLVYVNNSPDTLHEMYFHQYLNAFRPHSKWSERDAREHVVRFQNLREPDYGYERFTSAPTVNGMPVVVDYPGAPDSTVAHITLPVPLAPHDSLRIAFDWDARPSTVTRRQGRRGRTYDFAQWYPKVAVYDRGGWEPNPLIPAGELYGEYGTYDVTMIVENDQVLASTGVPVSGDPGWARVSRTGAPHLASEAYGNVPPGPEVAPPPGYRAVRFYAEHVHHFAWSASPEYIYEEGQLERDVPPTHFQTWSTVPVHVLYKPGDDTTWGGGRAVDRTLVALRWLESIFGPYAYPQFTNVHRLDPGGTEFPMMIMNGSASQGIILHEAGHNFTYGILGNNEWRSGWMDEGFTSYQTAWAEKTTPQERAARPPVPPLLPTGYRVNAITIPPADSADLFQWELEVLGRSQPIGTNSADFSEFGIYNQMIYNRAELMYSQLRDVLGDPAFRVFLHDYYTRWALKHVDERAMRASAERAYGRSLGWFFDEWVHGTGLMDYALGPVQVATDGHEFETSARVVRRGELRHPMPIGVLTDSGWATAPADPLLDDQTVRVVTTAKPLQIQLDPYHFTWDWDRRNDTRSSAILGVPAPRFTFNWPYLDQSDRAHTIVALAPALWYGNAEGGVVGVRAHSNYLSLVDIYDVGIAAATRRATGANGARSSAAELPQVWIRGQNLYLPGMSRPLMGYAAGLNYLDGIFKADLSKDWDLRPLVFTPGPTITARAYATFVMPGDSLLLPEQWSNQSLGEIGGSGLFRTVVNADGQYEFARASFGAGWAASDATGVGGSGGYVRADGSIGAALALDRASTMLHLRLYGGVANNTPVQRAVFASSQDPFETFHNDLFRPRGALFKQRGVNYLPLGGAGLRGFAVDLPLDAVGAVNGELVQSLTTLDGGWGRATISLSGFGDAGVATSRQVPLPDSFLADAGAGLIVRGRLYDRNVYVRLDAPFFVNHSGLAGGGGLGGNGSFAPRWTLTVGDLW